MVTVGLGKYAGITNSGNGTQSNLPKAPIVFSKSWTFVCISTDKSALYLPSESFFIFFLISE